MKTIKREAFLDHLFDSFNSSIDAVGIIASHFTANSANAYHSVSIPV